MASISESIFTSIIETTDFANATVEANLESIITKAVALDRVAVALEAKIAETNDEASSEAAKGVIELATSLGKYFGNLTPPEKAQVNGTVARIITGANEAEIEGLFDSTIELIEGIKALNAEIDSLSVVPDPE